MNKKQEVWLKAAVLGSIWGASEIVLGTFLHSFRIPFSSNLLTGIGIMLMIAGHRLWPERGLIWRAGLICAALKTLSPSHAIFGPMLAITMQAVLMHIAVTIGGRTLPSYLIGGGLAMLWNLAQRLLTALLLYGATLIDLYQSLVNLLERNTGLVFIGYWTPLGVLGGIFFIGGAVAALAGIYISKKTKNQHTTFWKFPQEVPKQPRSAIATERNLWVLLQPFLILLSVVGILLLIFKLPLLWSAVSVTGLFIIIGIFNKSIYGGVLRKPAFWIGMLIMVGLSGFLLGRDAQGIFNIGGLMIGAEMALRAIVVITGFKFLGTALRNPGLAAWFNLKKFDGFLMAVRIAFQTAPLMLESLPANNAWRNPIRLLRQVVAGMDHALRYMKRLNGRNNIIIITGQKATGKTRIATKLSEVLQSRGATVEGIVAPKILKNDIHLGYEIQDLNSGKRLPFAIKSKENPTERFGIPFKIQEDALVFGQSVLAKIGEEADLVVLDEVGPLELQGKGWAEPITRIIDGREKPILLVIRKSLVDTFIQQWVLGQPLILNVEEIPNEEIISKVQSYVKEHAISS